jgi:hypothetical protein
LLLALVAALVVAYLGVPDLTESFGVTLWVAIVVVLAAIIAGCLFGIFVPARRRSLGLQSGYFDHVRSVFDIILSNEVNLVGFPTDINSRVGRAFCDGPVARIKAVAKFDVDVVMLIQSGPREAKFQAAFASENVERSDFGFNVKGTWLHFIADHDKRNPDAGRDSPVRKINDIDQDSAYGEDIDAFKRLGYASLRTFAVTIDKKVLRVVVLCKTPRKFGEQDDNYLEMLCRALQVVASRSDLASEPGS